MRKMIIAVALALLAVAVVPAASARTSKTVTVSITNVALVPKAVSIKVGDSVKWTNNSTLKQQVACSKCPFTSPVLNTGSSFAFTFRTAGKFAITDPLHTKIKGSVTVATGPKSITLVAAPATVKYLNSTVLSGKISSVKSGQPVVILGKECGQTVFTHITSTTTGTGGKFSITQTPVKNTTYEAKWTAATSTAVAVHVRPSIKLAKIAAHKFRVRVKAAQSFVGHTVLLQKRTVLGTWVKVKTVKLKTAMTVGSTTITKATFRSRIHRGKKVRIRLKTNQAAPCYVGGNSNVVTS
jgi:plastocyanin